MNRQEMWQGRVLEWRASGQRLAEFCRSKEYTASALGYWVRLGTSCRPPPRGKEQSAPLLVGR